MSDSFRDWCSELGRHVKGRILRLNMLFDFRENRFEDMSVFSRFRDIVQASWSKAIDDKVPIMAIDTLHDVVNSNSAQFMKKGKLIPTTTDSGYVECSRIMDAWSLVKYNVDFTIHPQFIIGPPREDEIEQLLNSQSTDTGLPSASGEMTTNTSTVWVTKSSEVSALRLQSRSDGESLADIVRDKLGLLHFSEDEYLLEILYPRQVIENLDLRTPTFVDGKAAIYFQTEELDGWGATLCLSDCTRGLPEGVHGAVDFTDEFKVGDIGSLNPSNYSFNWKDCIEKRLEQLGIDPATEDEDISNELQH